MMPRPITPRALRRRAREHMPDMLDRQQNRCYFCGRFIIAVKSIPAKNRLEQDATTITYLHRGQRRRDLFATVEHLIPLKEGGCNSPDNLVATCFDCNC